MRLGWGGVPIALIRARSWQPAAAVLSSRMPAAMPVMVGERQTGQGRGEKHRPDDQCPADRTQPRDVDAVVEPLNSGPIVIAMDGNAKSG